MGDEQRRDDRDQLVREIDDGFANEGCHDPRQVRTVERNIDGVAKADVALATTHQEIERG